MTSRELLYDLVTMEYIKAEEGPDYIKMTLNFPNVKEPVIIYAPVFTPAPQGDFDFSFLNKQLELWNAMQEKIKNE